MSDFIDRLISRHLGLLPLIQPRRQARFESQAEGSQFIEHAQKDDLIDEHASVATARPSVRSADSTAPFQPASKPSDFHVAEVNDLDVTGSVSSVLQPQAINQPASTQAITVVPSRDSKVSAETTMVIQSTDSVIARQSVSGSAEPDTIKRVSFPASTDSTPSASTPPFYQSVAPLNRSSFQTESTQTNHQARSSEEAVHSQAIHTPLAHQTAQLESSSVKLSIQSHEASEPITTFEEQARLTTKKPVTHHAVNQSGHLLPPYWKSMAAVGKNRSAFSIPQRSSVKVESAPTVQVSIGRIEIKATSAPSQARKAPKKQPMMSLDDYLQRRNGGK